MRTRRHFFTIATWVAVLAVNVGCGGDKSPASRTNGNVKAGTGGTSSETSALDTTSSTDGGSSEGGAPNIGQDGGQGGDASAGASAGGSAGPQNLAGSYSVAAAGSPTDSNAAGMAGGVTKIPDVATATVTLAPATTYQTLEGFGAAIAWYQGSLTSHKKSAEIYQTIFGDLGLDVLRLRNTFGRSEFSNASKDKTILDAATALLGRRPKVLMTSWSPPAALKANNSEKCNGEVTCTLKKVTDAYVYGDFANYWYDAITAYRGLGISPDWVSIQNEPDYIPTAWEGCKLAYQETSTYAGYPQALTAVSAKLQGLTDVPKLIGPETLGVHWNKLQAYMPALNKDLLYAAAHHLYEQGNDSVWDWRSPGPDSYTAPMKSAKTSIGALPVFQTEFQTDDDKGTEGGLETAWLIHNSLVEEGVSVWLYWDLVWGAGRGLVSLTDSSVYGIRDQYYALRHYSLFTDPGYVRVAATATKTNVRVSSFRSPDQKRITVVVLNVGSDEEHVGFALGGFAAKTSQVFRTVFVPGSSARWVTQPGLETGSTVVLPGRSMATLVLDQ